MSQAVTMGLLFAIMLGQGFGVTPTIGKDGWVAAIRKSNDDPNKLNIGVLRNNNILNTKRDKFVEKTDDALYLTEI